MTNALRGSFLIAVGLSLILAMSGGAWAQASPPSIAGYGEAAIAAVGSRLPEVAKAYGLTAAQLTERLLSDPHLGVDLGLKLFYSEATLADFAAQFTETLVAPAPALEGLAPLENTFLLHSRPGSQRVIFLDFDGHVLSGTVWNDDDLQWPNVPAVLDCPAWNIEGGPSVFTDTERTRIQQVWQRVAEDYAPFDVDVTTEYPGEAALTRSDSADVFYGMRVLISPISSYFGQYGGVAYVGVFDMVGDYYKPALVFPEWLGPDGEKYIAEASSHENGHTLGLLHDGIVGGAVYYQGHGSGETGWAPIMGNGYYRELTQWSKGEYAGANNHEDDLARMLTHGLSYRADDHGDSAATPTPLPAGSNPTASGLISRTGDPDVFSFTAAAGPVSVAAVPASPGADLDILLELRDAGGTLLASNNPVDGLAANLSTTVTAGTYYITVTGTGKGDPLTGYSNYASLGAYTLGATLTLPTTTFTITLTSPNGAESWANGPPAHNVTWTLSSAVSVGEFRSWIIDGAGNWVAALIAVAAVPGQTNYSVPWTVAAPARADYTMVLYYRTDPSVWVWQTMDQSNGTFAVTGAIPTITLTSPNGAESWANGPPAHNVTWTLSSAVSVGEFRSWIIDGAGNWVAALIAVAAVPGQTNYSVPWTVAAPARADYTMVLYYRTDPSVWVWQTMDQSNGTFAVTGAIPTITLTSPNGAESWANGPPAHNVTWTLSSAVSVGEFRSWIIDGAGNWVAALIAVAAVPGQTNYSVPWTVAAPARADYTMVLYYRTDPSVWVWQTMDQSNGTFAVN